MLKLKLQYFDHLKQRADWLEKTLMLGKIKGKMRRAPEDEMVREHHRLNGREFEQILETAKDRGAWSDAVHGVAKS